MHGLVVAHVQGNDAAAHVGGHVHEVGLQERIVGARPRIEPLDGEDGQQHHSYQRRDADQDAERAADPGHGSVPEPDEPDEHRHSTGHRGVGQQREDDVLVNAGKHERLAQQHRG